MRETANFHHGADPAPVDQSSHVVLIDGSGFIFRAFYGYPPMQRLSDGAPVNAVHGFCQMLMATQRRFSDATHMAVIMDAGGPTFRHEMYPAYKAHRPPLHADLVSQFEPIRAAVEAFNVPRVGMRGYEADDLIATYATDASVAGARVTIVSSDKDLMQMIGDDITMYCPLKSKMIDASSVMEKFGVRPDQMIDAQALIGDASDNVPGVPRIGVKAASTLLTTYGDLDAVLANAHKAPTAVARANLAQYADQARLSRTLVTLNANVPTLVNVSAFGLKPPIPSVLLSFLADMEFHAMAKDIQSNEVAYA